MTLPEPDLERDYKAALDVARTRSAQLKTQSSFERLARLPRGDIAKILKGFTRAERARLLYAWSAWARPIQDPQLDAVEHHTVLFFGGRGWGKSRAAAERVRRRIYAGARSIALVGPTVGEVEKYMLGVRERDDGLMNVFPLKHRPRYLGRPTFEVEFHTGAIGYVMSAESPEVRGPNLDTVWGDEPIKWRYLEAITTNLELATRKVSAVPIEFLYTTTPKTIRWLKMLIADPGVVTLLGKSDDNPHNSRQWLETMRRKLGGTRLGEQELEGNILSDNPGAIFQASRLDDDRVLTEPPELRKAVAIDCAIATSANNDPTGIILAGADARGHYYICADKTGRHSPDTWAGIVVDMYMQNGCEAIVYEKNRGGNLIEPVIRAAMSTKYGEGAAAAIRFVSVHATKGKAIRAEPIQALHEQGRIHVVGRELTEFEDEVTSWDPTLGGPSPNRLDAGVWGIWYLARLDVNAEPDYRVGFRGLGAANATLQRQPGPAGTPARLPTAGARSMGPRKL